MKLLLTIGICLLAIACSNTRKIQTMQFADNCIVAHRGAWKKNNLPENSIAALKEAIRLKCTGSEFDIWMTSDDSLIINHDPAYGGLPIEKSTYAQLAVKTLSNGEKLPTLREYLLAGMENNHQTRLVLEIKPSVVSKERGALVAERVVQLVKELNATKYSCYISFDYDILKKILSIDPSAITQYLEGNKSPDQVKADNIAGIDYHYSVFRKNPDWIQSAKANKLILNAWTVNKAEDMDWLLANKFDYITTNEPELLQERINQLKGK